MTMETSSSKDKDSPVSVHGNNNEEYQRKQNEYKNVLNELIHTENSLVCDMETIYNAYIKFIEEDNFPSFGVFFEAISRIIDTGKLLLERISKTDKSPLDIAVVFDGVATDIKTYYGQYCSHYPSCMVELGRLRSLPEQNEKLKQIQISLNHLLPLESYLLKPVQRIMKYPLLLKEMVKLNLLEPEAQNVLVETQKNMIKVSEYINEQKREMEGISLLEHYSRVITNLQKPLTLERDGPVQLESVFSKGNRKIVAILFSKTLIITKPQHDGKLTLYKTFLLSDIILLENSSKSPTAFEISAYSKPKKKIIFESKKMGIKEQWITHIKALILENMSVNLNAEKLSAMLGEKVGGHVSTILSVKEDNAQARLSCEAVKMVFSDDEVSFNETASECESVPTYPAIKESDNEQISCNAADDIEYIPIQSNYSSPRCSNHLLPNQDEKIREKASTAMNILETISDYNIENELNEDKRKLYENVPWSAQLIQDAMFETEQILRRDSEDPSSTHSQSENEMANNEDRLVILSRRATINETPNSPTKASPRSVRSVEVHSNTNTRPSALSDPDNKITPIYEEVCISRNESKMHAKVLAKRFESLEIEPAHTYHLERSPIVGETLVSRLQKLFDSQKPTSNVVIEKHKKVTPKKASLIGQRLMKLQEKTMIDIQLSRSYRCQDYDRK